MSSEKAPFIGIDLGGTKISIVALSPNNDTLYHLRAPTPQQDYNGTISHICAMVDELEDAISQTNLTIGMGIPGSLCPNDNLIQNANSTWLNEKPLKEDLETALSRPVHLANDANCFALSESLDGAAATSKTVFGVILGTGVGGAYVIEGQINQGFNHIGGEWGHCQLPSTAREGLADRLCWCGRQNCIETWCSGPGLAKTYFEHFGEKKTAETIARALTNDDQKSLQVFELYVKQLATGLSQVINIIDPHTIVLGGGLSNIERLYAELPNQLKPHIFARHTNIVIKPPVHGDDSGVRGAARLGAQAADLKD